MFGYVNVNKMELKLREYEEYRALYCGVCKKLGKEFGIPSKMMLNFDFTFLALLGSAIGAEECTLKTTLCALHPARKTKYYESNAVKYSAFTTQLLTYAKLRDDLHDEKGFRKLRAFLLFQLYKIPFHKAAKGYPQLSEYVMSATAELTKAEKGNTLSIDAYADYFAGIMRETFAGLTDSMPQKEILKEVGYHTGRWIYLLDAFDDVTEDIKRGRFNPLLKQYSKKINESALDFRQRILLDIEMTLTDSLVRIAKAFALLKVKRFQGQLNNIIYLGMPSRQNGILHRKELHK